MSGTSDQQIDAMPTKAFFVDMLVKDIPLERAVLDLVDNCVDGAIRLRSGAEGNFSGLRVEITMTADKFVIADNCGGFDMATARNYAFRFGRARAAKATPYSIGQFGVGMKRALFKFGRQFSVASKTASEAWVVNVDVDEWEQTNDWHFAFSEANQGVSNSEDDQGTIVSVTRLRDEVASRFGSEWFRRSLGEMIRTHQRQFIGKGLELRFDGSILTATDLNLLIGTITPVVDVYEHTEGDKPPVRVRLIAGVGASSPSIAGWYVVCNGRVILASDRSEQTGWGRVAEQAAEIPKYHNQYARFRGIAFFECQEAGLLPWNTTKTGVDADSPVWRAALEKMVVMARSVINFLNDVDNEVKEQGRDGPLQKALAAAYVQQADIITAPSAFMPPDPTRFSGPVMKRISYARPEEQVLDLMRVMGLRTAKAVGEETFDEAYLAKKS